MRKTFRGKLADAEVRKIMLSTNNGLTGYKIRKFQLIGVDANTAYEGIVQVHSVDPGATAPDAINFEDPTILASGIIQMTVNNQDSAYDTVVFDDKVINQDIFVSHDEKSAGAGSEVNYYLELEQVKLDLNEATVATLKDMRGRE
jgi:hypothetical protein